MSTSVTPTGTTVRSGRSGRFIGVVAAGLAVAIAIGIVVAVNQGPEAVVPAGRSDTASPEFSWQSRTRFMEEQYAKALAESAQVGALDGSDVRFKGLEETLTQPQAKIQDGSDVRFKGLEETLTQPQPNIQDGLDGRLGGVAGLLLPTAPAIQEGSDVRFKWLEELVTSKAHAEQQAMWDQRYEDMVEHFETQSSADTGPGRLLNRY